MNPDQNVIPIDLKNDPNRVLMIYNQIIKYYEKKLYEEALFGINFLIQGGVKDENLYQMATNIYYTYGDFNIALLVSNDTISHFPKLQNYYNRLKILKHLNKPLELRKCLDILITLETDIEKKNNLIFEYIDNEDLIKSFKYINDLYQNKKIDVNTFYNLFNYLAFKNYAFTNDLHPIIENSLKTNLKIPDTKDETLLNNLKKCNKFEYIHALFLLTRPDFLKNNTAELLNHSLRIHKNLSSLINFHMRMPIFSSPDDLIQYFPYNFYHLNMINNFENQKMYEKISQLFKNICKDLEYTSKNLKRTNSKLKIGIVSGEIYCLENKSVFKDNSGLIMDINSDNRFDLSVLTIKPNNDAISVLNEKINLINLPRNIEASRKIIESNEYDILLYLDFGIDIFYYILAHSKLAPIQMHSNRNLQTSGIKTLDYFISSKFYSTINPNFTERLINLRTPSQLIHQSDLNMIPLTRDVEKTCVELNIPIKCPKYGLLINLYKFSTYELSLISNILLFDQNALVFIISNDSNQNIRNNVLSYLNENLGQQMSRIRVIFTHEMEQYYKTIDVMDVILDTIQYGSYSKIMDGIARNKIVMTLPMDLHSSKIGTGLYSYIKITEPISRNMEEYIGKAIRYANNPEERTKLLNQLSSAKKNLLNNRAILDNWKEVLLEVHKVNKPLFENKPDTSALIMELINNQNNQVEEIISLNN